MSQPGSRDLTEFLQHGVIAGAAFRALSMKAASFGRFGRSWSATLRHCVFAA
jgi:hypothetical protein